LYLLRRQGSGGLLFEASKGQIVGKTLPSKIPNRKRVGGATPVIIHLVSKYEALISKPQNLQMNPRNFLGALSYH
jgi:hypothetical protein